jgi:hypothetical protein
VDDTGDAGGDGPVRTLGGELQGEQRAAGIAVAQGDDLVLAGVDAGSTSVAKRSAAKRTPAAFVRSRKIT